MSLKKTDFCHLTDIMWSSTHLSSKKQKIFMSKNILFRKYSDPKPSSDYTFV